MWHTFIEIVYRIGFFLAILVLPVLLIKTEGDFWKWVKKGGYDTKEENDEDKRE